MQVTRYIPCANSGMEDEEPQMSNLRGLAWLKN
jgi:hypothetical protein